MKAINPVIREDIDFIIESIEDWSPLSGATVLISGASGFIPAYMVEVLLVLNERGICRNTEVIGVVRNLERAKWRFADYAGRGDLWLIAHDVNRPLVLPGKVDFIVHAASQASPKYYGTDPVGTLNTNVIGTYNLLEFAREKGVRDFLFFSSGEVYGEVDESHMPIREEWYGYVDPMSVRSCYAESKRMGETMCISWSHQYGVPVKIVRPFHTYGPGMKLDDGRVFADFVADIVNGRDIVMKSDGSALRAFCYLSDATAGFFKVLLRGANRKAYNVGNDRAEVSILELANLLVDLFPARGLKVIRHETLPGGNYLKSRISRACPDLSQARGLGWEPRYTVEEGFARTVRSFLQ